MDWIYPAFEWSAEKLLAPTLVFVAALISNRLMARKRADAFLLRLYEEQVKACLELSAQAELLAKSWTAFFREEITRQELEKRKSAFQSLAQRSLVVLPWNPYKVALEMDIHLRGRIRPKDEELSIGEIAEEARWFEVLRYDFLSAARTALRVDELSKGTLKKIVPSPDADIPPRHEWIMQFEREARKRQSSDGEGKRRESQG